jgi:hypothetical protein
MAAGASTNATAAATVSGPRKRITLDYASTSRLDWLGGQGGGEPPRHPGPDPSGQRHRPWPLAALGSRPKNAHSARYSAAASCGAFASNQRPASAPRLIPLWAWMRLQALLRARRDAV